MERVRCVGVLGWWVVICGFGASGGEKISSCVSCHRSLSADTFTGKNYIDWKDSVHALHGVQCEECHGGNSSAESKEEAHKGVYPSSNPSSLTHFQKVPETCGKCHRSEREDFSKSLHWERLEDDGRGPNCVTCHGSRATSVPSPEDMETLCEVCHNRRMEILPEIPKEAFQCLVELNRARTLISEARDLLYTVGERSKRRVESLRLEEAEKYLRQAVAHWHKFDLKAFLQQVKLAQVVAEDSKKELARLTGKKGVTVQVTASELELVIVLLLVIAVLFTGFLLLRRKGAR